MVEPGASRMRAIQLASRNNLKIKMEIKTRDEIRNEKAGWGPAALENFNWLRWVPGRS
jgi:hypothetical protein